MNEAPLSGPALKEWYDDVYWSKDRQSHRRPPKAYRLFLDYLQPKPGGRLLDVACGSGSLLAVARERQLGLSGIDFSETACTLAKALVPEAHIVNGPGEALPFDDATFDYITCLGSLEHFVDIPAGLREMVRVSKAGAKFCILVPNSYYLFDILQVWKKGTCRNGTLQPKEALGPLQSWKTLIESEGLKVLAVHRDREPLDTSWSAVFRDAHPGRIMNRLVEKILQSWMPVTLGYQFAFICERGKP